MISAYKAPPEDDAVSAKLQDKVDNTGAAAEKSNDKTNMDEKNDSEQQDHAIDAFGAVPTADKGQCYHDQRTTWAYSTDFIQILPIRP